MVKIVTLERRISQTEIEMSKMWKLFIAQFINTGILVLVVNLNLYDVGSLLRFERQIDSAGVANLPLLGAFIQDGVPIFKGRFDDFLAQWYDVVGVALVTQTLIFVFTSSVSPVVVRIAKFKLLHRKTPKFYTQHKYDTV